MKLRGTLRPTAPALLAAILLMAPGPFAQGLRFSPTRFLPGDTADGMTDGHQQEVDLAAGGAGFLAVWSDARSSLDDFQGLMGSGFDVYGALLDADGNVLLRSLVIDEGPGNQVNPHVAWNGEHWLVAWIEPDPTGLPTYDRIRAVRVATDGTVLDPTPILLHEDDFYFSFDGLAMAGGGVDGWTVIFEGNDTGLRAVRVAADGSVATPAGGQLITSLNVTDFDIAFAQDEYMVVWKSTSQLPKPGATRRPYSFSARGAFPFADEVATDGLELPRRRYQRRDLAAVAPSHVVGPPGERDGLTLHREDRKRGIRSIR